MTEPSAMLKGQRLQTGKCPYHGTVLVTKGDFIEKEQPVGRIYGCGQQGCEFTLEARNGSRMMKLLR